MYSGNKSARGTSRVHPRPPRNRGITALRRVLAPEKRSYSRKATGDGSLCAGNSGPVNLQEESFQLHPCLSTVGKPFAMFIRLQPETLEELKQANLEGQEAMMKFGAHVSGHEIKVGSEIFQFSSASEPGDLCDIYEQKTEENVLIEAASVWRKLCVQRILSATEKDRVKKRTAEAERQQRLRKSILVDPTSQTIPSAGIQESNKTTMAKITKKPPTKKCKIISSASFKNSTTLVKGCLLPDRTEKIPTSEMISVPVKLSLTEQVDGLEKIPMIDKESLPLKAQSRISAGKDNGNNGSAENMTKLRNFLISFLQENPKGSTIKEAEKAVVDRLSSSMDRKIIAQVIKSIAIYHAPGRYFLKLAIDKESIGVSSVKNQQHTNNITLDNVPSVATSRKASMNGKKELLCSQGKLAKSTRTQDLHFSLSKEVADEHVKLLEDSKRKTRDKLSAHNISHNSMTDNTDSSDSSSCSQSVGRDSNRDGSETYNNIDYSSPRISENTDEEIDILSDNNLMKKSEADCQLIQGLNVTGADRNSEFPKQRMKSAMSLVQDFRSGHVSDSARNQIAGTGGKQSTVFLASYEERNTSLHGPIQNIEEYNNYYWEFKEKYPTYYQLHVDIETFKRKFQVHRKDGEYRKLKDGDSLHAYGDVRKEYMIERKRCKHKYNMFQALHEELKMIKNQCKEYAEKAGIG